MSSTAECPIATKGVRWELVTKGAGNSREGKTCPCEIYSITTPSFLTIIADESNMKRRNWIRFFWRFLDGPSGMKDEAKSASLLPVGLLASPLSMLHALNESSTRHRFAIYYLSLRGLYAWSRSPGWMDHHPHRLLITWTSSASNRLLKNGHWFDVSDLYPLREGDLMIISKSLE